MLDMRIFRLLSTFGLVLVTLGSLCAREDQLPRKQDQVTPWLDSAQESTIHHAGTSFWSPRHVAQRDQ
jgi:hypothetical protein